MAKKPKALGRRTKVKAAPAKAFFVSMLTRDIDLSDAILDLLDNCVDGIARDKRRQGDSGRSYRGYWARIVANPDGFEIFDNCGGIAKEVAIDSAFMLGRPDLSKDSDIETVGMYGIGMKRAIFKLGLESVVRSETEDDCYEVPIPESWMKDDNNWNLRMNPTLREFKKPGTKISIEKLRPEISRDFSRTKSTFLEDLEKEIATHYSLILGRGFSVYLNGQKIAPVDIRILAPKELGGELAETSIEPYVFMGEFDDVSVELAVGFYRGLATQDEVDKLSKRSTRENAGWTVICNDRIVLHNDKTIKTGWGTGGVPSFHNQFIAIAGVAVFRSKTSVNLPLNTTKRGIDMGSDVYHLVLPYMQQGLKKFTAFTNDWKQQVETTTEFFKGLDLAPAHQLAPKLLREGVGSKLRKLQDRGEARHYSPKLPKPNRTTQRTMQLSFSALKTEVKEVASYYFDGDPTPQEIGKQCFDEALHIVRENG